jgi:hypothetical protein
VQKPLQLVGEARCCCHEVASARRHDALSVQCGGQGIADPFDPGRVIAGRHKRRNAGASEDVERGAGLTGRATPVRTTDAAGHRRGQRSIIDAGCSRKAQELPQDGRVCIEPICEDGVTDLLETKDLSVGGYKVIERRLDERERADVAGSSRGREHSAQHPIRMRHHVGAGGKQRREIRGVSLEVLALSDGWWARPVAAPMHKGERPARP